MGDLHPAAAYEIPPIFSLNYGLKPTHVPTDDILIKHAENILEASALWQEGKSHQGRIRTYIWDDQQQGKPSAAEKNKSKNSKPHRWYCLVAKIKKDEISFSKLWSKLGKNQIWHHKSHLASLAKVTRVQYISEQHSIWTTLITLPPPLSPRVYTVYQASFLLEYSHNQRGIIVTLPVDLTSRSNEDLADLEERGIRGRYLSIEHIQEIDGDVIEWRKVACRDLGGMIPKFWVQKHMAQDMAEENISFMNWIRTIEEEDAHDSQEELGG